MNGSEDDDVDAEPVTSSMLGGNGGLVTSVLVGVIVSLGGGVNVIGVGLVGGLLCSSGSELQPNMSCW